MARMLLVSRQTMSIIQAVHMRRRKGVKVEGGIHPSRRDVSPTKVLLLDLIVSPRLCFCSFQIEYATRVITEKLLTNSFVHRDVIRGFDGRRLIFKWIVDPEHHLVSTQHPLAETNCRFPILPAGCNREMVAEVLAGASFESSWQVGFVACWHRCEPVVNTIKCKRNPFP